MVLSAENSKTLKLHIQTWVGILKTLTVEPAAILVLTAVLMSYLITQDLIIERVCKVNLGYDVEVCDEIVKANGTYEDEEIEIQKVVAEIRTYTSIIDNTIPLIFILFIGPWSDIYGRKIPMMLGAFAYVLNPTCLIVCSYFESINGHWVSLSNNIIQSILGGNVGFAMMAHSYIADTTDVSIRTVRTGILEAALTLGIPAGLSLGGAVRKAGIGYITSFIIAGAFSALGCIIVAFAVKNRKYLLKSSKVGTNSQNSDDFERIAPNLKKSENTTAKAKWWHNLDVRKGLLELVAIPFKRRENSNRLYLWLLIVTWICVSAPTHGEFGVMYLYLRQRLNWDSGDYGFFSTYTFLIGVTGTLVSMGILKYGLKLSDPLIGFLGGFSQFGGCVLYVLASTATMMYLAPTIDMMNGTMAVIARSMISKIVSSDEVGKTFTLIAILETLIPLVMDPAYSTLYRLTVDIYPGYIFILSAALTVPPQIIYAWMVWDNRSGKTKTNAVESAGRVVETANEDGAPTPAFSAVSLD